MHMMRRETFQALVRNPKCYYSARNNQHNLLSFSYPRAANPHTPSNGIVRSAEVRRSPWRADAVSWTTPRNARVIDNVRIGTFGPMQCGA